MRAIFLPMKLGRGSYDGPSPSSSLYKHFKTCLTGFSFFSFYEKKERAP